ncbi:hypothetical protein ACH5RR_025807 [Cinchona calisaya]|uniref:Uncharacterized protein n=1 Tax=Cinchona calisaya TaxID=153742 RepID=A0ABD2Z425_9GENT
MARIKTSLKKGDLNTQRERMPITLGEYFPKRFLRENQVENVNMTSSIEIEDKDVNEEVEILAKPTKDNGFSVELDLSSLESIIHSLFELLQEARRLLVNILQECDGKDRRSRPDVLSLDSCLSQMLWHDESPIVALRAWGERVTSDVFPPFADTATTTFYGCSSFGAFTALFVG